ncbi:MAG: hypothetical protein PHU80_09050 [Kiritimatiellae bacterium]|nr:hypothetical protein [Kiritimatiellia bacterium]
MKNRQIMLALVAVCGMVGTVAGDAVDIGGRLEMFVDRYLVDSMQNTALRLHAPRDEGEVLRYDAPWEGSFCGYNTVIYDNGRYLLYYRGKRLISPDGVSEVTCFAESKDGKSWVKPKLGLFEANGSKENNIILAEGGITHNFSPFLDTRPGVSAAQRFKALGGVQQVGGGLYALVSEDGIHWKKMQDKPVLTKGAFDSQNVAFWSEQEQKYVACFRIFTAGVADAKEWKPSGLRSMSRADSPDFLSWSETMPMKFEPAQEVHLYINQTHPYFRAPHLWVSTAARFMQGRRALTDAEVAALQVPKGYFGDTSDSVLLTSRDGLTYQQTFREALIRPSLRLSEWVSRTGYPALNVVPTGPDEMSLYVNQDYTQPTAHLRRYSMRLDGFASVNAPYEGGEMTTKPLLFKGSQLLLNFATSAAGSIHVEIQDADGKPLPGFAADDCVELLGNRLALPVQWKKGGELGALAGRPVRLRFVMKDADLYALRFVGSN